MKNFKIFIVWCNILHITFSMELHNTYNSEQSPVRLESDIRGRRDVIEEEKFYNHHTETRKDNNQPTPWIPHVLPPEDPTTKISLTMNGDDKDVLPLYQTTERVTDKPTGRGARASNENWIKLPYPPRDEAQDNDVLAPPQPSGELINSRMPRINFVTQNKQLETSESRNDKESIQRPRADNIRTEFVRPGEEDRAKLYKPVYTRQALYYPEESRRYNDDRYYEEPYRRDPYYDMYERRGYSPRVPVPGPGYGPRIPGYDPRIPIDRYDEPYDNSIAQSRKPKRIIYYAHLPEVVRTPPSVDLRYRYSPDPYRRYEDDYARTGRYDYRFRNRYPYAPLRKEDRNYRDLTGAGTALKDKKTDEKVTPTPVLPKKEENYKSNANLNRNVNRNLVNSHQYHDGIDANSYEPLTHKGYPDVMRSDDRYLRYEEPLFQAAIEDPYHRKY